MNKSRHMVRMGLYVALLAISAWMTVPAPVPFTMQTMAVLTIGALLGSGQGCICVGVYLLLGVIGVPVFSGFRGGVQVLLGPTGGYLLGFLLSAFVAGWAGKRFRSEWILAVCFAAAVLLCYGFGTLWYALLYSGGELGAILLTCVVPVLLPDALKIVLSLLLLRRLRTVIH